MVIKVWNFCIRQFGNVSEYLQTQYQGKESQGDAKAWYVALFAALSQFVVDFCGTLTTAFEPVIASFASSTVSALSKLSGLKAAEYTLDCVTTFVNRVLRAIKAKSFAPLWGPKWDPGVWLRYAQSYEQYFTLLTGVDANDLSKRLAELRRDHLIPDSWCKPVSIGEYLDVVHEHLDQGTRLIEYFSGQRALVGHLVRQREELSRHYSTIRVQNASTQTRIAPLMVYLYGKPGVGKSVAVKELIDAIAAKHHLSETGCYAWQTESNFQDGLNSSHHTILMDDVDTARVFPPGTTHCSEIINLVNLSLIHI